MSRFNSAEQHIESWLDESALTASVRDYSRPLSGFRRIDSETRLFIRIKDIAGS